MSTQTIYANNDAYSYEYIPNTVQNTTILNVRGDSGYRCRSYFGFDITSAPGASAVTTVQIALQFAYVGRKTFTGRFSRITGSWAESTLTWNNVPATTSTNQTTHSLVHTPTNTWFYYDITAMWKDAKNAGNVFGVQIMDNNEYNDSENTYQSRTAPNPPRLVITYTGDYYVETTGNDASAGTSWATAWKTINKAATTVADGTTVHIGFGTYDAEPAANKIAPQNVGASGIYYLPETATTGGGTGTVSVEQNS